MDKANVVKLALDAINHKVSGNFSQTETSEVLRQAFVEANGGSTVVNYKSMRRNPELFEIIEEIIPAITKEGLTGDEFFVNLVDYRNVALGDDIDFWVEDKSTFIVSDAAHGTQGIRRQRLNAGEKVDITTSLKVVKVYEELNRLLSGRVDFNAFVNKVGEAFTQKIYNDIYSVFNGISVSTAGMTSDYYKSGTFSEDTLVALIDHVEASTGKVAKIVGTRSALRKVTTAVVSNEAKSDMYNAGFYGKFNGTDMIVCKQKHAVGTDVFILDTDKIYIIASDDKPIKCVDKGEGYLFESNSADNSDLTKEYLYGQDLGVGLILNGKIGIMDLA